MKINKRINFENKSSNTILANSKYIITSNEINEIKDVINKIIFTVEESIFNFNEATRFLNIIVPERQLETDLDDYFIEIVVSKDKDFKNSFEKCSKYNDGFYKLENGKFKAFKTIGITDVKRSILIDISDLTIDNVKEYFIKYRFFSEKHIENEDQKIYTEFNGMTIGSFIETSKKIGSENSGFHESNEFIIDIKNLLYDLTIVDENDSSLTGNLSVSAEFFNGEIEKINDFKIQSLDNENQKINQIDERFIVSNIDSKFEKLIGISYIDKNNRKFLKPIILKLNRK